MIGNDKVRLGWFRDARCIPPAWPFELTSGQTVSLDAPGKAWQVRFIDPLTGRSTGESRLAAGDGRVRIVLPEFRGAIAIRLTRLEP